MMSATRSAILSRALAVAALVATVPTAAACEGAENGDDGRALFEAQCADCHGARDIADWAALYPDAKERRAWMDGLLQRHYPPSKEERPLIVDHIEKVIEQAGHDN
jgi:mono/diheme cytochrome c family protein